VVKPWSSHHTGTLAHGICKDQAKIFSSNAAEGPPAQSFSEEHTCTKGTSTHSMSSTIGQDTGSIRKRYSPLSYDDAVVQELKSYIPEDPLDFAPHVGMNDMSLGPDEFGRPPILRAALWGRADLVAELLRCGTDVTEAARSGMTAVHASALPGNSGVRQAIIDHVGPTQCDTEYSMISQKTTDLCNLLTLKGAFHQTISSRCARPFHRAIRRARRYQQHVWEFVNGDSEAVMLSMKQGRLRHHSEDIPVSPDSMEGGRTALHRAACDGSLRKAKFVINCGASIDMLCEIRGWTALQWAVYSGSVPVVSYLLQQGANIDAQCQYNGHTPLHLAVLYNNPKVLRLLLDHKCDLTKQTTAAYRVRRTGGDAAVLVRSGSTVMHYVMVLEDRQHLAAMIIQNLSRGSSSSACPFARDARSRAVEYLMGIQDDTGRTAVEAAVAVPLQLLAAPLQLSRVHSRCTKDAGRGSCQRRRKFDPSFKHLYTGRPCGDIFPKDIHETLLRVASEVEWWDSSTSRDFIECHKMPPPAQCHTSDVADPEQQEEEASQGHSSPTMGVVNDIDSCGRPAILRAALHRRAALVKELLAEGADPTEPSVGLGDTAIRVAVADSSNGTAVLEAILDHVAPSAVDMDFKCVERKREALKELLAVEDRIGIKVSDYRGAVEIQKAINRAYEYMVNICKFVVDDVPRADLMVPDDPQAIPVAADVTDWTGETALFNAVRSGHLWKAEFLLANGGATVDKEVWGMTALHEAVLMRSVDLIRLLLKHGANPNLVAKADGLSCLHAAIVSNGGSEIVRCLLANGADPAVRSEIAYQMTVDGQRYGIPSGSTAMHFAIQLRRRDTATLILEAIGPQPSDRSGAVRDDKSRRVEELMQMANDSGLLPGGLVDVH
ncbi:Ankyrin Repeat Protein, partial [Perkinsus chesapeaki]